MSFVVVNDTATVATIVPQRLTPEHLVVLRREGGANRSKVVFKPSLVNQGFRFLMRCNLAIYDAVQKLPQEQLPDDAGAEEEYTNGVVPISEEDEQHLDRAAKAAAANPTIQSLTGQDVLLMSNENLEATEDSVKGNLAPSLTLRRMKDFVTPQTQPRFYEKTFVGLYPYGRGGQDSYRGGGHSSEHTRDHALTEDQMTQLLLKRGGDRRFSTSMAYLFTTYSYFMRKRGGTVSLLAAEFSAGSGDSTAAPADPVTAPRRDALNELRACPTAQDIVDALSGKKGQLFNTLIGRLQPYAKIMPGSSPHIANEKKGLMAMMRDSDVRADAQLRVFNTISPADRYAVH